MLYRELLEVKSQVPRPQELTSTPFTPSPANRPFA